MPLQWDNKDQYPDAFDNNEAFKALNAVDDNEDLTRWRTMVSTRPGPRRLPLL